MKKATRIPEDILGIITVSVSFFGIVQLFIPSKQLCFKLKRTADQLFSLFKVHSKDTRTISWSKVFFRKDILKNLRKVTGKYLCWSLVFDKNANYKPF